MIIAYIIIMAIRHSKVVSKSQIEPSLRIKQRDYTIPVRLNQLQTSQLVDLTSTNIKFNYNNNLKQAHHHYKGEFKVNEMMMLIINPISIKTRRFFTSSSIIMMAVLIATLTSISTDVCHCDTRTTPNLLSSSSSGVSTKTIRPHSLNNISASQHKEHLLSSLSDNIERQHLSRVKQQVRALVHQRPSKFDSGDDLNGDGDQFGEMSNFIQTNTKSVTPPNRAYFSAVSKVDEGMRHILRMHELANQQSIQNNKNRLNLVSGHSPSESTGSTKTTNNNDNNHGTGLTNRWREISRAPVRAASNLMNQNKMASHVISYISPLVSPKLLDQATNLNQKPIRNATTTTTTTTAAAINSSRLRLPNPFVARSNNHILVANNLLNNFEQKKARPGKFGVTVSPQTSYLARPDSFTKTGTGHHQYATQPTTWLDNFGDSMLKPALFSKSNSYPKDLMAQADTSSSSATIANPPSVSTAQMVSSTDSASLKLDDSQTKSLLRPQITNSWLAKSANQLAQNYIQDSFRGLLTLSQLPILSASSISTAPSVLEKNSINKSKQKGATNTGVSTQSSQNQRNRIIDELYRYAYILGTGARRKRDPLMALGSSPPNSVNSSPLSLANQKGVFSQRSINQLLASNHSKLLNYTRRLMSMLPPSALSNAKPRGVMWDMATDPSLAVTVFHLLERASVALPLGFLLMPFVRMIRNPLNGFNLDLGRILPAKASHRSVDYEELAKRLDVVDKMLSRALRPTHRESFMGK